MTSKYITEYLRSLKHSLDLIPQPSILKAWDLLNQVKERGGTVFTCGNGGSAALADHLAQDLIKQCYIKSHSLTSLSMITALANDETYRDVFSRQLDMFAGPQDLLIVVSGSGNSPNILQALHKAKLLNISSLALVGFDGGKIISEDLADLQIHIPSMHMGRSEDGHLIVSHILIYGLMEEKVSH